MRVTRDMMSVVHSWWSAAPRWERLAVVLWLLIMTGVATRVALRPCAHTVYPIFSASGRLWRQGCELYEPHRPRHVPNGYRYSPTFAVLIAPLSLLPDRLGGIVWRWGNVAVYLLALGWWARTVLPRQLTRNDFALLLIFLAPLSLPSVNNGQPNVLVTGLLLGALAATREKRWNLAALCIGIAFVCKIYPLALGLVLVLLYPRQLAGRLAAVIAGLLLLPFLCQPPDYVLDQYGKWVTLLLRDDRSGFDLTGGYRDLWMLIRLCHVPLPRPAYQVLQMAAGLGVAALCWIRQRRDWPEADLLLGTQGLTVAWMLLLGPATESCTYVMVAPSLAWAILNAVQTRQSLPALGLLLTAAGLLLVAFGSRWLAIGNPVHSAGLHPWAVVLWSVYALCERPAHVVDGPAATTLRLEASKT